MPYRIQRTQRQRAFGRHDGGLSSPLFSFTALDAQCPLEPGAGSSAGGLDTLGLPDRATCTSLHLAPPSRRGGGASIVEGLKAAYAPALAVLWHHSPPLA